MIDEITTTPEEQQVDTSQVSEETATVEQVETPEEVSEQPTESHEVQQTQEQKPTRAEKRLNQLLSKNKRPQVDPYLDLMSKMPEVTPDEDGNITQDQLQQLIQAESAKTLKQWQENQQYNQQVETFTSEVEEVGNLIAQDFKDPALAEKINNHLVKVLQSANLRTDQYGREVLVPVLSAKEAYQELKDTLSLTQQQGQAQATASMAQQIAEGAITPSTRQNEEQDVTQLSAADIFKNPTAVREAIERKYANK